jgi:hypothetical protein
MAWAGKVISEDLAADGNFEAFTTSGAAIFITLNPRELLSSVINIDWDGAGTDEVEIQVLGGHQISSGNTPDVVTDASNISLDTAAGFPDAQTADDDLTGRYFVMTTGGEIAEVRLITSSAASDDSIVLDHALSDAPETSETYDLYSLAVINQFLIDLADPAEDVNLAQASTVMGYPVVLVMARVTGTPTDSPTVRLTYDKDGVSA